MGLILIDDNTSFGERVKIYRKEKNMTQEQLAKVSGMSRYLVSKIETGNYRPGFDTIMTLASALEMPAVHVFKGDRFSHVMGCFCAGKTVMGKYGPEKCYGKVEIRFGISVDTKDLFCITLDGRTYMASYGLKKNASSFVCADRKTGVCHIFEKRGRRKVIGSVMSDVTDDVIPICF